MIKTLGFVGLSVFLSLISLYYEWNFRNKIKRTAERDDGIKELGDA
jgi:hypothetical protein